MTNESTTNATTERAGQYVSAHLFFWIVAITATAADLVTKWWAFHVLKPNEPVTIIPDFLHFNIVRNAGAVFGMGGR